ncbi:hypothetical protein QVD17_38050 [Tagetes erecta]|uniref:Uncharacterized protein n=1 Tax=Tagetes erecta TaxID=13708 RepID=A0AAD8JXX8_TARER|nr:hypothetical protein QVD17_38050 [Tagetes erecta]
MRYWSSIEFVRSEPVFREVGNMRLVGRSNTVSMIVEYEELEEDYKKIRRTLMDGIEMGFGFGYHDLQTAMQRMSWMKSRKEKTVMIGDEDDEYMTDDIIRDDEYKHE